jgi:hypothetical protein
MDKGQTAFRIFDATGERGKSTARIAPRRFYLDYVGAKIGEEASGVGGGDIAHLDDPNMTEGRRYFALGV